MDLLLDSDGDLDITGGNLTLTSGIDAVVQRLRLSLRFFRGEWFLDRRVGVPYFERILVKGPNIPAITTLFRDAVLADPEVTEVLGLELDFAAAARTLAVSFTARTTLGETVVFDRELILI